jgi:nitrite reductase/ring-hydroxylating ferredoxin subunit
LAEGVVEGGDCICPWHGWRFNVTTGISPVVKTAKVDTFAVVIEGRDIKIKVN